MWARPTLGHFSDQRTKVTLKTSRSPLHIHAHVSTILAAYTTKHASANKSQTCVAYKLRFNAQERSSNMAS
eukprot:m.20692 g.20692  ORF g.20692 m.20692 type:complete len:71 (+) comp8187_c0_seq2:936-1148(+)